MTSEAIDWSACSMITPAVELGTAPLFRTEFNLSPGHGQVASARLHITSLGVYEARLNGRVIGEDVLGPGWSSYEWRLRYCSYDVTQLIDTTTVLTVCVGNGWYRGRLGFMGGRAFYGDRLGLMARLEITFTDGTRQLIVTDDTWQTCDSDILADDLYDGQTIDARKRTDGWYAAEPCSGFWLPVRALPFDPAVLVPHAGPLIRRQEVVPPVRTWSSPSGSTIVDFGQNMVGWLRFTVSGPPGSEIRIRHAEVLEEGELGTRPLRTAQATDRFILSGDQDFFEPTMTFHGFRYAEITGWPSATSMGSLEAVVVHSDLPRTGQLECSDPLLTQLHANVVHSTKGNFLAIPADCPQRDERLGWTGDIAVFAPTAAYLFDAKDFLADWLEDLALEQAHAEGIVPFVVPDVLKFQPFLGEFSHADSTAIWSDAAVWVPWALWQAYGDRRVLERQYVSMRAHLRRVSTLLSPTGLWDQGFQFGDWLDPDAPPDAPEQAKADPGVVATACLYRSASIVAETAALLDHHLDAADFRRLAERTREAFNAHYVAHDGMVKSECATVLTLAIVFGLLDDETERSAGKHLARVVSEDGYQISTGFAGTPYVTEALARTGHVEDAYRLLLQRQCPSWLYPVTMGATTIWERWDSMLPDGTVNPGDMTSFNHYALGAVADWMHRTIGGISPLDPGYSRVLIAPRPGGGLTWARAELKTPHGQVRVNWDGQQEDQLVVEVDLPEGVTGVLSLEGRQDVAIPAGRTRHCESQRGVVTNARAKGETQA